MIPSLIFYFYLNKIIPAGTWDKDRCNMNPTLKSSSIIFITAITILTGEELNNFSILNIFEPTLAYDVVPVHYDIRLTVLITKYDSNRTESSYVRSVYGGFLLYGESSITINILRTMQNIKLHIRNLSIHYGKTMLIKNNGIVYRPMEILVSSKTNVLDLRFSETLSPGFYTLKMDLINLITDNNEEHLFRSSTINKEKNIM